MSAKTLAAGWSAPHPLDRLAAGFTGPTAPDNQQRQVTFFMLAFRRGYRTVLGGTSENKRKIWENHGFMTRKNFYTSAIANTVDTVKIGIQALAEEATKLHASSALIIGKSKSSLDGLVSDVIGEAAVKALQKGQAVRLGKGPSLEFHYGNGIPQSANGSPLLVCFPDKTLMHSVDVITNAPALIVLPWTLDDINPWLLARGATDLLNATSAPPIKIANPVVEEALKTILALINVSTGIVHPSDKATVVGIFRALQKANEQYDPEEVDAWFIQQGMHGKYAAEIGEVAANPKGFRATSDLKKWGPSDVKRWRDAVKSKP